MMPTRFGWQTLAGVVAIMVPAILLAANTAPSRSPSHSELRREDHRDFDALRRGLEEHYHAHATHIPMQGLIGVIARISTHGSVRELHVAEFDDLSANIDAAEMKSFAESRMGGDWKRIVVETSRDGGELSLIYVRPEGDHLGMMVLDLDNGELNMVEMSMNPARLAKQIARWENHSRGRKTPENAVEQSGD